MRSISIDSGKILRVFGFLTLMLITGGFLVIYFRANYDTQYVERTLNMFDLNRENNIPTWYASISFVLCSMASWLMATLKSGEKQSLYWKIMALIFLGMSIDEAASVHEYGASLLKGQFNFSGYWHFAWVIPALILIILGIVFFFRFWWSQPSRIRFTLAAGAIIFFTGSVGMEMIGGKLIEQKGYSDPVYMLLTLTEEIMELTGLWLFQYALLESLALHQFSQVVRITNSEMPKSSRISMARPG
jgi:hypothetical protein